MKTRSSIFEFLVLLSLAFLWGFVGRSKLSDTDTFFRQLYAEGLSTTLAHFLSYAIPIIAILTGLLAAAGLVIRGAKLIAFTSSSILLLAFTSYMLFAVKLAPNPPCSCIALGADISWDYQLYLSAALLISCLVALRISFKQKESKSTNQLLT